MCFIATNLNTGRMEDCIVYRDLEELLILHASPTLAGIKTANLFSVRKELDTELKKAITDFNRNMRAKKVRLLPIGRGKGRTLLYIYRPDKLEKDLTCRECVDFLRKMGYPVAKPYACLKEYADRLSRSKCFLHEIGFFLGYPSEDVISFMEEGPKKSLCCGAWRAYKEKEEAIKIFRQFKKCRENYYFSWKAGKSLNELTPAI